MSYLVVIGSLIASLIASPVAAEAASAPTEKITVEVAAANGSGCPAGTTTVSAAADNTSFTVAYTDYLVQVGGGASPVDFRKNCQLSVQVNIPQGFTYAIARADYRGYASLAAGATGLQQAAYYFQGESQTAYKVHPLTGPFTGNWQTTDVTDVAALVYAPCGAQRIVNINTELRVSAGTSDTSRTTSYIWMDSSKGSVRTIYSLVWKEC
jgi:hypothetical protein